jgi:ectoine hydroxylase-related dioxygenase (phytanoyl-CoA dioxygenase family)
MTSPSAPAIPDEVVEAFARDGVVCLRGAFSEAWVDRMRRAVDLALSSPGPSAKVYTPNGAPGRFSSELGLWTRLEDFRSYAFDSPAPHIAARLMGSRKINLFFDHLLVKEPGTRERTPWHQDYPYWTVSGWQVCSIWMPLDPVEEEVSLQLVRGSHRWGVDFQPYNFVDGHPYAGRAHEPPLPDIEADRGRYDIASYALDPGDCIVFHASMVHGAAGNVSSHRRRALSTRWTGDDATYLARQGKVGYPLSDPGLKTGDPMDCALFPRVLPR